MFGPEDPVAQVFDPEPPIDVIDRSLQVELSSVIVCGVKRATGELYFTTSEGNMGDALVLLELARKHCLELVEERMRRAITLKD